MSRRRATAQEPLFEFAGSLVIGAVFGLIVPPPLMGRVDEMLVTFLSIVVGAAIPGVAITAAALRPPMESAVEAQRLGERLQAQVRFWFSYMLAGGLSIGSLVISHALAWSLATPRPSFLPSWVPSDGGSWLVAVSVTLLAFTIVRLRHVVGAVLDLIGLGTVAHVEQSLERRQQVQQAVAEELAKRQPDPMRGSNLERRDRIPRH